MTLGVYQQYEYGREKRAALELWENRCLAAIVGGGGAKIVPLRAGA